MVPLRCIKRLNISSCFVLYLVLLIACVAFVCFLYHSHPSASLEKQLLDFQDFIFSTSETARNWLSDNNATFLTAELLKIASAESNGFLAATRTNRAKTPGSAVCVVDPAITDCQGIGFAAFLLGTLDYIMVCSALGINRPTVFWRACNSICSRDPRVNSWDWYFEPINYGLESKVENVLCLLRVAGDATKKAELNIKPILDNSFKNRTDVDGFEDGKIITTDERMRVNKLIQQYLKPNSIIKEKVRKFYQRYLAGFTVLGVHVRGTDHWKETSEKRLPSLMSWVKRARSILETLPRPRKIFIASDNNEVIQKFVTLFGKEMVVFTEAVRAKKYHNQIPPHGFQFEYNAADPYERQIGTQVLMDILLLAKCDHFLHTESSVASLASYFNPHMTSHFLQDEKPTKNEGKTRLRRRIGEAKKTAQGEPEDWDEIVECFLRNSVDSACPNTAKGMFVNFKQTGRFLRPRSAEI